MAQSRLFRSRSSCATAFQSVTQTPPPNALAQTYAFLYLDFGPSAACAKGYTRTRSRIGPSKWEFAPAPAAVAYARFFNSLFTKHTETPPCRPDDSTTSIDFLDLFPNGGDCFLCTFLSLAIAGA